MKIGLQNIVLIFVYIEIEQKTLHCEDSDLTRLMTDLTCRFEFPDRSHTDKLRLSHRSFLRFGNRSHTSLVIRFDVTRSLI